MSTNFPGALDSFNNPASSDKVAEFGHAALHTNNNDAIEALQAKVGADDSADTDSHDYKLSGVTGSDKAASKTGAETLENKTLTSPTINTPTVNTPDISGGKHDDATFDNPSISGDVSVDLGSDAEGDIYYRNADGELERLPIGDSNEVLTVQDGLPSWEPSSAGGDKARVRAYKSDGNLTLSTGYTQITFGTENYDTGNDFESSTFTAPRAGVYAVTVSCYGATVGSTEAAMAVAIYVNDVIFSSSRANKGTSSSLPCGCRHSDVLTLQVGDTVKAYALCSSSNQARFDTGSEKTYITIVEL